MDCHKNSPHSTKSLQNNTKRDRDHIDHNERLDMKEGNPDLVQDCAPSAAFRQSLHAARKLASKHRNTRG